MGCYNSAIIPAPVDDVWAVLRNFHDVGWAANVVTSVKTGGSPDEIGATRVLNDAFEETLIALDDGARVMRYSIDDGPGPVSKENVSGYVGEIRVFPVTADETTFVLWTSSWASGGDGAAELCNPIYQGLLQDLKKHFS